MGRDEEIKQVAENYASIMCKDCPARILFCEERNMKCAEYREQVKVYADGAKWADQHPANVWHSADEEPEGRELMNEITFAAGNENIQIKKLMQKYGNKK